MAYTYKHGDRPLDGIAVQRAVGRGGFGEVYYALADSGKQVALKFLRENPEIELRGISHVMNLKSPHLITVYDVKKSTAGDWFVLMEYITGPSLRELLDATPDGMGVQKAAFFLSGIAKGLSYLHERGIVHRDLKPGNIFYDDGYVKIGDYGLSKHIAVSAHSGNTVSVGTVHYMAPEIGSGSYSKAIDIYALGVILYEMLTGRLPFAGSSMGEILMRHLTERPDTTGIREPFASVIARALAKNPADRFASVDEMVDAVVAAADVSAEMKSFDPGSLYSAPRGGPDTDRTMTTPHRAPAVSLDARDLRGAAQELRNAANGLGQIPEIPPLPGEPPRPRRARAADPAPLGPIVVRERWPTITTMAIAAVAVGIGTGILTGREEAGVAAALYLAGATVGVLLSRLWLSRHIVGSDGFPGQLLTAACGFVAMLPGIAAASDADPRLVRLCLPIIAALGLCDWRSRIDAGRKGAVRAGTAFSPAFIGFIGAAIVQSKDYMLVSAAICAMTSILVQMGAGLFPRVALARRPGDPRPPARDDTEAWLNQSERPAPTAHVLPPIPTIPPTPGLTAETDAAGTRVQRDAANLKAAITSTFGDRTTEFAAGAARPVSALARGVWSLLFALALAGGLTGIISFPSVHQTDKSGVFFCGIAGLCMALFFGRKMRQGEITSRWRDTIRPFLVSALLAFAGGMVSVLQFEARTADEKAAATFGLLASSILAIIIGNIGGRAAQVIAARTTSGAPALVDVAAPSFVGRTASAGLSFLGKACLLVAVAWAATTVSGPITINAGEHALSVDGGSVFITDDGMSRPLGTISKKLILAPLAAGALLLTLSRSRDGAWHILRGLLGSGLVAAAVVIAVGPMSATMQAIAAGHAGWLRAGPVLSILGVGAMCLLWPRRSPQMTIAQGPTIIV